MPRTEAEWRRENERWKQRRNAERRLEAERDEAREEAMYEAAWRDQHGDPVGVSLFDTLEERRGEK